MSGSIFILSSSGSLHDYERTFGLCGGSHKPNACLSASGPRVAPGQEAQEQLAALSTLRWIDSAGLPVLAQRFVRPHPQLLESSHERHQRPPHPHARQRSREPSHRDPARRRFTETKAAFKTTEFVASIVAVVGVLIAAGVVDEANAGGFGAQQAWLFVTVLTVGYMVSRGLARVG